MNLKTGQTIWVPVSAGSHTVPKMFVRKIFLKDNATRDYWRSLIGQVAIYTSRRKAAFGAALYNKMAKNRAKTAQ